MPLAALKFLKHSLKKSGFIYLALPNAKIISNNLGFEKINEKGFRTSFLRPVHLSYFHPQNVEYISSLAGLKPIDIDTSSEIFMLLSKSNNKKINLINNYVEQKNTFDVYKRKSLISDSIKILIDLPKAILKRILQR